MEEAEQSFGDVPVGAVGFDFGQVYEQRGVGFGRADPEIGDGVSGERDRCRQRFGCVAEHLVGPPLPGGVVAPGVDGGDAFVAGVVSRSDAEIDLVGVFCGPARPRLVLGKEVSSGQVER